MLPRVQPIAPIRRTQPFDDPEWVFDVKYDGFRGICYLERGCCRMVSRNGNPMIRFAGLGERIAASLDVGDAIFDGEVIAADETGRPQFYDLLRDMRKPVYVAFDVIWLNGIDLRALPLTERRHHLQNILPKGSAIISEALSVTGRGRELFELMCAHDLEGVVAKRPRDGYGSRALAEDQEPELFAERRPAQIVRRIILAANHQSSVCSFLRPSGAVVPASDRRDYRSKSECLVTEELQEYVRQWWRAGGAPAWRPRPPLRKHRSAWRKCVSRIHP